MAKKTCHDCGSRMTGEYYMVHDEIWEHAGVGKSDLCIGCLETRIGRQLQPDDFAEVPVNDGHRASDRLLNRLGLLTKAELKELKRTNPTATAAYLRLKNSRDALLRAKHEAYCRVSDAMQALRGTN